jgi:ketosteroid isomerase-like protein
MTTPTQIVQSFFEAFGKGDINTVLSLIAEDAEWKIPGADYVPIAGQRHGREQIKAFFGQLAANLEPQAFNIYQMIAQDEHVIVLGYFKYRAKPTQKAFESDFALHIVVRNGKVSSYHIFEDTYNVALAFKA